MAEAARWGESSVSSSRVGGTRKKPSSPLILLQKVFLCIRSKTRHFTIESMNWFQGLLKGW